MSWDQFGATDIRFRHLGEKGASGAQGDFGDFKNMPGLVDAEARDEEAPSDSEEDDEEADKDESHDSSSAVLGPCEGQDRGGVQKDTPSLNIGPQIAGALPREEELEEGPRDVIPAPVLVEIDGDLSSDDEEQVEGAGPGPPPPGLQPTPTPWAPSRSQIPLQVKQGTPRIQAPHQGPPGPRAPPGAIRGTQVKGTQPHHQHLHHSLLGPLWGGHQPGEGPGEGGHRPIRGWGWGWGSTFPHGRRRWAPTSPP